MTQAGTATALNVIPLVKTDTIYVSSPQEQIVNAIGELGDGFTENIDSLSKSVIELKNEQRILDWVSNDALFATLTSILVFALGLFASYLNTKNREKKNRKKIRSIVFLICKELSEEFKKQAEAFDRIASAIDIDNNAPIPMEAFQVKSHKQIKEIKYERIYDAFQGKLKHNTLLEQFNMFWADITSIEESISPQKGFVTEFIKFSNQYQTEFESTLSQIATIVAIISTTVHGSVVSQEHHSFFKSIDQINEQMQGDANPPTKIKSSYVDPLLALFNNPKYYDIHRNGELPNLLRKAQMQFINLNNYHTVSKENALTLKNTCETLSKQFKAFIEVFDQKKRISYK